MFAFAGPAYLVSVGYMDPGNWATDLAGGALRLPARGCAAQSNLMAVLLQTLSARLGVVTGRDLAQACRDSYPRWIVLPLLGSASRHRRATSPRCSAPRSARNCSRASRCCGAS